jgi:Na+/H+ antiporter NhaD/arsenite permease-like protein
LVVLEDVIHINKAKSTLFIGMLCWLLAYLLRAQSTEHTRVTEHLNENLLEIPTLWLFLISAMTFVAYLNSKGFISSLVHRILPHEIHERTFMFLLGMFSFVFSSLSDNVTATLVSLAVITSLRLDVRKRLKYATLIVFAVNSGGVSLITGDVTTLMIFMAGKVSITNLLLLIALSLFAVLRLASMMSVRMRGRVVFSNKFTPHAKRDIAVALIFIATILSTLFLNAFYRVPPVLTFLFGLIFMFLAARISTENRRHRAVFSITLAK